MAQVVSLSFFRFDSVLGKLWALTMMGAARLPMARVPGIGFWKLLGSGTGEGFTPVPNTAVYAILATWPDLQTARNAHAMARVFQRYRNRATEHWTLFMTPQTTRGAWSGKSPFHTSDTAQNGPLAALTRASIRPRTMARFWGRVPNISKVIGTDPNVLFKIGVGEIPWLHQVTFSIWPDASRMAAFARTGPHADAIKAVRQEDWFAEELYARFSLLSEEGSWGGASPIVTLDAA